MRCAAAPGHPHTPPASPGPNPGSPSSLPRALAPFKFSPLQALMLNMFPKAEAAAIEPTIGHQMPSASPPADQEALPPSSPPKTADAHPYILPPAWFHPTDISPYEASLFSEPEYIGIRNMIIEAYKSTGAPMTLRACRSFGPFGSVLRIFNFLEENCLINYEIEIKQALLVIERGMAANQPLDAKNMAAASPSPSQGRPGPFPEQFQSPHMHPKVSKEITKRYVSPDFFEEARCSCGESASHFTSELFFICKKCFQAGRFPPKYNQRNFHEITPQLIRTIWTKKDEFTLLKGIELHGDDWAKISAAMNKSPDECIFHFIKMSLIDECPLFPSICFGNMPNPVTTFIAYVAYILHPVIASKMAKTAIKYIECENLMEILISVAVSKAREIIEIEKSKVKRLEDVRTEAMALKLMLKVRAIRDMSREIHSYGAELDAAREKLRAGRK